MCAPFKKYQDPISGCQNELIMAMSSLNMPESIIDGKENELFMADKFEYAHHSYEHLQRACQLLNDVKRNFEDLKNSDMKERWEYYDKQQQEKSIEMCSAVEKAEFATREWYKLYMIDMLGFWDNLIALLTFRIICPKTQVRAIFSEDFD